ncbi:MAG: polysaccharide biosynthesis/export family protein [Opitutaceae bacterium]|nr:polysaccharide biosynthesis/export family protein [Opitutaceae bacterium]HRG54582.1 polysaccharide biosynthesis/export family protein [Lacunisphaera sp.]
MRFRPLRLLSLVFLGLFGSLQAAEPAQPSAGTAEATDYVLQPSDLIRVLIFQEPDLLREVRITQECTITLPLIGTIDLRDRTVRQAEEIIRSLYDRDYLVNPQVNLTVLEYTQRTVQVVGAVNQPGAVVFPPEQKMGLVEAIARAGGQSRLADLKRVRLTRTNAEGRAENLIINVDDMMKGASNEKYLLQKGDIVFVPERLL